MKLTWRKERIAAVLAVFLAVILGSGRPAAVLATEAKEPVSTKADVEDPGEEEPDAPGQPPEGKEEEGKEEPPGTEEPKETTKPEEKPTTPAEETTTKTPEETTTSAEAGKDEEPSKEPGEETSEPEGENSDDIEGTTEETTTEEPTEEETDNMQAPDGEENRNPGMEAETGETLPADKDKDKVEAPSGNQAVNIPVLDNDIINVVVPASYVAALNPDELDVDMGDGTISNEQILAKRYGIVNKSSCDVVVTMTLVIEDENKEKITFVDSPDKARDAGNGAYALYLAAVPADTSGMRSRDAGIDTEVDAAGLSDVHMAMAEDKAVTLHTGSNQMVFRLSRAVYGLKEGWESEFSDTEGRRAEELFELKDLAYDGTGVTAFTFRGAMNQNADWSEMAQGIKISVIYSYKAAESDKEVSLQEEKPQEAEYKN